jgi:hypothetical protein
LISTSLPQQDDSWRTKTGKAILSLRQDSKVNKVTATLRTHIQSLTNYRVAAMSALQTANGMIIQL